MEHTETVADIVKSLRSKIFVNAFVGGVATYIAWHFVSKGWQYAALADFLQRAMDMDVISKEPSK